MDMLCKMFFILMTFFFFLFAASDTLEIARNKPTKQSTNIGSIRHSQNAVDGDYLQTPQKGDFCTHTDMADESSWWAVDLGAIYEISNVIIFGRNDGCCVERFSNFDIEVFKPCRNNPNWFEDSVSELCYHQQAPITFLNASCHTRMFGQYVRIRLNDPNPLTLCEVEVHGTFISYPRSVTIPYTCGFQGYSYEGDSLTLSSAIVKSDIYCTYMCAVMKECHVAEFNKKTSNCTLMKRNTGANVVSNSDHNVFLIN